MGGGERLMDGRAFLDGVDSRMFQLFERDTAPFKVLVYGLFVHE